MCRRLLLLCAAVLTCFASYGQRKVSVSGFVREARSGENLIAAEVVCGSAGVTTDADGHYSLSLPEGKVKIRYYYSGYITAETDVTLQRDTLINVELRPGEVIDASVVTASGESGFRSTLIDAMDVPLATINKMPVILGESDVLKAAQLLPGVQSGMEGFSGIYVRGGGADENLFLLDGVALYNVSHLLGVFSAFTPESIKKATLYKGAFPARYGGRVSGVLDLRTIDGDMYETHGSVNVGLITSKLHLNGPIVKGKTSYALSGRLMHTAIMAPAVKLGGLPFSYYFYDLNGKIVHRFSDADRLSLSVYHGHDVFDYKGTDESSDGSSSDDSETMDWGNTVAALRWYHVFNGIWSANTVFAYNRYGMTTDYTQTRNWLAYVDGYLEDFSEKYNSRYVSGINDFSFAWDASCVPSNAHSVKTGVSVIHHHYSPSTRFIRTDEITGNQISETSSQKEYKGWEAALYGEDEISFSDRFSVNAGLRFVLMTSGSRLIPSVQPRASVRYSPWEGFAVKAGYARMGQYVHQLSSTRITLPSDLWVPVTEQLDPVISDIGSTGVFYDGLPGWEISLEGYYKFSRNVIDYRDGASMFGSSEGWEQLVEMGVARSYGLETLVRKTEGKLTGWLAYTLSKTERKYPNGYINSGRWFPYQYDRRHVLNLNVSYALSGKINLSATWSFSSGGWATIPERTTVFYNYQESKYDNLIKPEPLLTVDYISGKNNYNLPPSHTLNLAVNFNRQFRHGERTISVSVYNAYNAMNPNLVYAAGRLPGDKIVVKKMTFLPVLPSFNYTYRF